jgi:hypothetical protein
MEGSGTTRGVGRAQASRASGLGIEAPGAPSQDVKLKES